MAYGPSIKSLCIASNKGLALSVTNQKKLKMTKHTIFVVLIFLVATNTNLAELPGTWELLVEDVGVASMHTAVTHFNTVILLDRTNIGPSHTRLPGSHCISEPKDPVSKKDCYAHSVLLDLQTLATRPLTIVTDTWCSSGQFLPDGTLLQTGGDLEGFKKIRKFTPCDSTQDCDWQELEDAQLSHGRWYGTNQILPDGSIIIIGGRESNSVEYYPPRESGAVSFPFLSQVQDHQMDNLYPFVHLLPNGQLFIFANNKAVSYDYITNTIVKDYPVLEGGPRNYPSAGSSAMLPLAGDYSSAIIVICGGAEYGAYLHKTPDSPAHGSCGRIEATGNDPAWEMEDMPIGRIMGDMVTLPTGEILIINGAAAGSQGFEMASQPCLFPLLYRPEQPIGLRFMTLNRGSIPRMYHSTANLLPDGRVLLAGSNPHYFYNFVREFPTELRVEAFSPEYLASDKANIRPALVELPEKVVYGQVFEVVITVELPVVGIIEVNFASAPFATHSFSQGQRLVKLAVTSAIPEPTGMYRIRSTAPPDGRVAPPGYYMLFAVNQGVPSVARWVQLVG